ncbi:hypothetical protein MKW94_003179, partial [Papaver nudicaule]|nr:hypothetical protein [Papaver nudicaule]
MEMRKEDRLSKLPNALIQHVLAFLPIKDVVSTCILSKRWRNVWVSTDVLDFRRWWRNYLDKQEGCCDHEMDQNAYLMAAKVFLGFVERVLTVRDGNYDMPTLRKCYLEIDQIHFHRDTVEALVSTIVRRQVKELILDFQNDVTDCEYSDDDCDEDEYGLYEYPLKKLYLPQSFFTCESLTKFFRNCPILEDLSLHMCTWKVVMDASRFFYCIPSLKILRMSDFVYEDMSFANVLVTSLPTFNKMTRLVLAYMSFLTIQKLFDFLHNAPNLESLVFDN